MSEVTVGSVFQAYRIVSGKRQVMVEHPDSDHSDYGKLLDASVKLEEFLGECTTKVELPPELTDILVPLLSQS